MQGAGRKLIVPSKWVMEECVKKGVLISPGRLRGGQPGVTPQSGWAHVGGRGRARSWNWQGSGRRGCLIGNEAQPAPDLAEREPGEQIPPLTPASPKSHCRWGGHCPLAKPTWKPEGKFGAGQRRRGGSPERSAESTLTSRHLAWGLDAWMCPLEIWITEGGGGFQEDE